MEKILNTFKLSSYEHPKLGSRSVFVSVKLGVCNLWECAPNLNMVAACLQTTDAPLHLLLELGVLRFVHLGSWDLVTAGGWTLAPSQLAW